MKKLKFTFIALALVLALTSCKTMQTSELQRYSKTILTVFDTSTTISGFDVSEEAFNEKAAVLISELEEYHKLYDIYHNYEGLNNIKTINDKAGKEPVKVDEKLIDMLQFGVDMYSLTGGKTNIAMGSVLDIWHYCRTAAEDDPDNAVLPSDEELRDAAAHTDIKSIVIDKEAGTVFITDPDVSLDVGAVAKGYATDRIADTVRERGWTGIALSVGGNVKTVGTKSDGSDWRVGIQNPDLTSDKSYFCLVNLSDKSLVTSGSYQRFYTVNGVRYHHIIDPSTLYPENTYVSVSIICESSAMGDALSTALFNMSYEDGLKLIDSLDNTEAVWMYSDEHYVYSPGFEKMIASEK